MRIVKHSLPKLQDYFKDYEMPDIKVKGWTDEIRTRLIEDICRFVDYTNLIGCYNGWASKKVNVEIIDKQTGEIITSIKNVIAPVGWDDLAIQIFATKYFANVDDNNIFKTVSRVLLWIALNGIKAGYFGDDVGESIGYVNTLANTKKFISQLSEILLYRRATFNSPVWFNMGVKSIDGECTTSACYINKLDDDISSILAHNVIKQIIAIGGSGSGCNLSVLRSENDTLSNGGKPSGPCGFFRMFDGNLGAIKSSGKTRRAAGLVSLFHDHPDALKFIRLKANEEAKASVLQEHMDGWDNDFAAEGPFSHRSLSYQNINCSIRLKESFWKAYANNKAFIPSDRHGEHPELAVDAHLFLDEIARAAWECGDPGIQYDDNINKWNPFIKMGDEWRFNSTNACQPGFATVLTPDGIRVFDEIIFGDTIWSGKKWTKIAHKIRTGRKPVFAYHTMAGTFYGTDDHTIIQNGERIKVNDATSIDVSMLPDQDEESCCQFTSKIERVVYVGMFDVYDITVDAPEHTYWTGGLSVSNCSELNFLDDSACNLATLRLTTYYNPDTNTFDFDKMKADIGCMITAMDILIDYSTYPTGSIAYNAVNARNLGLNFADLGELLFLMGLPYDSDDARNVASMLAAFTTGCAYAVSHELGKKMGGFSYLMNPDVIDGMSNVITMHSEAMQTLFNRLSKAYVIPVGILTKENVQMALEVWENLVGNIFYRTNNVNRISYSDIHCLRNSQVTLMAPTGTVSLVLGCRTSGIEPHFMHSYTKELVGGGNITFDNNKLRMDIMRKNAKITGHKENRIMETAVGINTISPSGHIRMMAAIQPYISGGISKTVNVPNDITMEEIRDIYYDAHEYGLKSISVYRDNSKTVQPLNAEVLRIQKKNETIEKCAKDKRMIPWKDLKDPQYTLSIGIPVHIGDSGKIYIHFGWHPLNTSDVWEIFLRLSGVGGTLDGTMGTMAILISKQLQNGFKQEAIKSLVKMTYAPNGFVGRVSIEEDELYEMCGKDFTVLHGINQASSIPNFIGRALELLTVYPFDVMNISDTRCNNLMTPHEIEKRCPNCHGILIKVGSSTACFECNNCGYKAGSC